MGFLNRIRKYFIRCTFGAILLTFTGFPPQVRTASLAQISNNAINYVNYLPFLLAPVEINIEANVFYISPLGNDGNSGTSEAQAWKSFNRAWEVLFPGDTLILLDGVYTQSLNPNKRNGELDKPITIRAKNDGKAIIDGEYQRIPVKIGDTWPGPIGEYFVIEGIVAKNSAGHVVDIQGNNNIFRRVSAYNANSNDNKHVFQIWADNNLIEDCVAAGTGRKMIMTFQKENNIIRRCFTYWQQWDGRDFCPVGSWPNGQSIQIYHGRNNIIENSIGIGPVPNSSISIIANSSTASAIGNQVFGSIAVNAGINIDGSIKHWGDVRPQPTECIGMWDPNWPGQRSGFSLDGQGEIRDNIFQDIFSWGNAGLGLSTSLGEATISNNRLNRATLINNGLDNPLGPWPGQYGGLYTDALQSDLGAFDSIENSNIQNLFIDWPNYPDGARNMTSLNGEGARLTNRYVDGVLTNEPLWPWPMEDRIQAELGFSVTDFMTKLIFGTSTSINDHETIPNTSLDISEFETTLEGIENEYIRKNIR
jgi:hypothetical protein